MLFSHVFAGVVILVTHTERMLPPLELINILYKKYDRDSETGKPVVKIHDYTYTVHPQFRLYFSINTTIHVKGLYFAVSHNSTSIRLSKIATLWFHDLTFQYADNDVKSKLRWELFTLFSILYYILLLSLEI